MWIIKIFLVDYSYSQFSDKFSYVICLYLEEFVLLSVFVFKEFQVNSGILETKIFLENFARIIKKL